MIDMKKLMIGIVSGAFLFGLLGPTISHAQAGVDICTVGEERSALVRDRIQNASDSIRGSRQEFRGITDSLRATANSAVDRTGERYREASVTQVEKLLASNPNPDQESAALEFKAAVEALVAQRVTDHRALNDAFYDGVAALAEEKIDQVLTDLDVFQNETIAAFDRAGTDCRAGVNKDSVLSDLETKLKAAKSDFLTAKANFQIRADLEPLLTAQKSDQAELFRTFANNVSAEGQILTGKWNAAAAGVSPGG